MPTPAWPPGHDAGGQSFSVVVVTRVRVLAVGTEVQRVEPVLKGYPFVTHPQVLSDTERFFRSLLCMPLAARTVTRAIVTGLVLGVSGPALSSELSENWRIETQIGRLWPAGRMRRTFGEGFLAAWTVGRRLFADVIVEGGVRLGSIRDTAAQTVTDTTGLPGARGLFVCTTRPSMQQGSSRDILFGASGPVKMDRHLAGCQPPNPGGQGTATGALRRPEVPPPNAQRIGARGRMDRGGSVWP
jgi:hypothetical protein